MVERNKTLTCRDCHHWLRVNGKDACDDIPQMQGKPEYKFLESLKPCEDFWRVNLVRSKKHA